MMDLLRIIQADLARYFDRSYPFLRKLEIVLLTPALWVIMIYRLGHACTQIRYTILRKALMVPLKFLQLIICVPAGIEISFDAKIGKGLYIGHFGEIFVNPGVRIGENCNISQGVTIGVGGRLGKRGCPVIGDRVYIAPGAKIFGKIKIGNDVAIGANAVVTKDIPDKAVVVGIPARIVNFKSSKDFIR